MSSRSDLDPITFEVIKHRLWNLNIEHGEAIMRASGSPICVFGHDFNPCILTADAEYVFYGPYIQFLSSAADLTAKWIMEHRRENPGINEGDMFLSNDPWIGATHQMDVTVLCPVFVDDELFCWVGNTLHQADIGGTTPGSFCPDAIDVFHEPTPMAPVKVVEGGLLRADIEDLYVRQSRMPALVALDLRAAIGGNTIARAGIHALVERYGKQEVTNAMRRIIDDSESVFLHRLARLPDGLWRERGYIEQALPGDRGVYRLALSLEKRGDALVFGNEGTSQQAGALNCTTAGWRGGLVNAVSLAFCYDQLYAIGGPLRHLRFDVTPGTICSAEYPAAVSNAPAFVIHMIIGMAGNVLGRMLIADPVQRRKIFTSSAASTSLVSAMSATNQHGDPWAGIHLEILGGGICAFSHKDGVPTGGLVHDLKGRMPDIEEIEQTAPLLHLYRRELKDSAGPGRWSRAVGPVAAHVPHGTDVVNHAVAGAGFAAPTSPGLFGGHPGAPNRLRQVLGSDVREWFARGEIPTDLSELSGTTRLLQPKDTGLEQRESDAHEFRLSAGAGYGDPLLREPWRVAEDVALGYLSHASAEQFYGVVLADDAVNTQATDELRASLRRERLDGREPAELDPAEGTRVTESLLRDGDFPGCISCRMCRTEICSTTEVYKEHVLLRRLDLSCATALAPDPAEYVDERFEFREFYCPACGTLIETEIALASDPLLRDIELSTLEAN